MKQIILFIFILISCNCFSQKENSKSTLYFYRDSDIFSFNRFARVLINDSLKLFVGKNEIHTINLPSGSIVISLSSKREKKLELTFETGKNYYFKIMYHYAFILGKYELLEVTPEFADSDLKANKYRKEERILMKKH